MQRRFSTLVLLAVASPLCGVALGAFTNAINGQISADYFAIVMSWDWIAAPTRAIAQGMLEGFAVGLLFGFVLAIAVAASTRVQCPPRLALKALALALAIVVICWLIGGMVGTILARVRPSLWGFVFIGVPRRVNLPRFAWVGGSILGAYAGAAVALVAASVFLHIQWKRLAHPPGGFLVMPQQTG